MQAENPKMTSRKVCSFLLLLCCGAGLLAPRPMFGQADQGSITGVVEDNSGAVVAQAAVTLTSTDTGLELKTTTDSNGIYTFSPIKIGNYSVSASASGFATTTQQNLQVHAQSRLSVPLTLQLGSVSQSVWRRTPGRTPWMMPASRWAEPAIAAST